MTQPIFRESLIFSRLWSSRRSPSNGVRKIFVSFPTTLAVLLRSYMLTIARQDSNPFSLLVNTIFDAFSLQKRNSAWEKFAATLLSSVFPQSSSRISNSTSVASSPGRVSTDLMISLHYCHKPETFLWHSRPIHSLPSDFFRTPWTQSDIVFKYRTYIHLFATFFHELNRNSERDQRISSHQVFTHINHNILLQLCSCRGTTECGNPPVQCPSKSHCVICRCFPTRIPENFNCLIIVRYSKCFVPNQHNCHFHQLELNVVTRALMLRRPAPRRIAIAPPADARILLHHLTCLLHYHSKKLYHWKATNSRNFWILRRIQLQHSSWQLFVLMTEISRDVQILYELLFFSLQTSAKIKITITRHLLRHNFLYLRSSGCIVEISAKNECVPSVLPHRPSSSHHCCRQFGSGKLKFSSTDKYASMTLEHYDLELCNKNLIVRELSLIRAFFFLQTRIYDPQFWVSWISFDFNTLWRFPKRQHKPQGHVIKKIIFHTRQ